MIRVNELRGIIAREGKTHAQVANRLGISRNTFSTRLRRGVFDSDEIATMIEFLNISDPISVFFADDGTRDAPA